MKAAGWAPRAGDAVWLDFDPQAGREQAGRRPALVVSPLAYNAKVGLALMCPITHARKGYPFETPLPDGLPIQGVVLTDHVRSLDWRARRADLICQLPDEVLQEVIAKLVALVAGES